MTKKYSYSAEDESLVTPVLYTFLVDPLVKVLPYRLPANLITLSSFTCIAVAFGIAVHGFYVKRYDFWWLIPLLTLAYLVGDCADGKQARKTGTGSPLGEYFDHFWDSFVTGLLMGILMISFGVTKPFVIVIGFFNLYCGQIGAFWERYKLRVMYFGKLGTNEGVLAIGLTSWLMSIPIIHTYADRELLWSITGGDALIIVILSGAAVSAIHSIGRTKQVSPQLITHLLLSFILTCTVSILYTHQIVYITLVVALYNVFFLASLLAAINSESKECFPDIIVPLSLIASYMFPAATTAIQYAQIIYLAIRVIIKFAVVFKLNKQYWYWINPPPPEHA